MTRHMLRLVILVAFAIGVPQLASAMGPISAAQKNQGATGATTSPDTTGTTPKPHHHTKHKHKPPAQ